MDDGGDAVRVASFLRGDYTGEYGFDNELGGGILSVCSVWNIRRSNSGVDNNQGNVLYLYKTIACYE